MDTKGLPPEVIALIHHVELADAGWYDQAIQQLVLAALWIKDSPLSPEQIVKVLQSEFQIHVDKARVRAAAKLLQDSDVVLIVHGNQFKIANEARIKLHEDLQRAQRVREEAARKFQSLAEQFGVPLDWERFEAFLQETVQTIGATTYSLFQEGPTNLLKIEDILGAFPSEMQASLRELVRTFLDPNDQVIRSYMSRLLYAYFLMEAVNLRPEMLERIRTQVCPQFDLFFDTNFLFSILGLHENPDNEAALALLDLIFKIRSQVSISCFVLPITVEEAKSTLNAARDSMERIVVSPNLAKAALQTGTISGLARAYLTRAAESPNLSPSKYFGHYASNLVSILKGKGIKLLEEQMCIESDPEVQRDLIAQRDYEREKYGELAKSERELKHDIAMWHFLRDKRPPLVESPADACYWIVTIDHRFLAYDAYKRRNERDSLPLCVHPTTLIQMLSFWVPRSAEFEKALIGGLRFPFFAREYDVSLEKITLRILEALSGYASILPEDTISSVLTSILTSEVLRQRLQQEPDERRCRDIVHNAVIEELQARLETHKSAEYDLRRQIQDLRQMLEKERTEKLQMVELVEDLQNQLRRTIQIMEGLHKRLEDAEAAKAELKERIRFFTQIVLPSAVSCIILGFLLNHFAAEYLGQLRAGLITATAVFAIWAWCVERRGARNRAISEAGWFKKFYKFRKWFFGILGAILLTLLSEAAKKLFFR